MAKDPSKTEKATHKRRKKARDDGNVPKGQELGKTMVLVAGFIALHIFMGSISTEMKNVFTKSFREAPSFMVTPESVYSMFQNLAGSLALMLLPSMLIMATAAFLTQRLQVGPLWTMKVFKPKLGKMLNVPKNLQKMLLSRSTFVNLAKSLLMAIAIGVAPYIVLTDEVKNLAPLFYTTAEGIAVYILNTGSRMVLYALVPMLIIAIADTWYTRWDYEENLKMSKDEVKDEHKQQEGNPEVKKQQRDKMFQAMARRMMQDVPKADVVITNPTHIAVALSYDAMEAPAPMVLAMGADHLAQKIKEVAREHNVPIRENKPLARALYKSCEIGEQIPEELFKAVAQILAEIFKLKRSRR